MVRITDQNLQHVLDALQGLLDALPECDCCGGGPATYYYDESHYCEQHAKESGLTDLTTLPWRNAVLTALEVL